MLKDGKYPLPNEPDGFAARLRQVVNSYGSTSALARTIERSEGAVRKWLRGQSEPAVSDLRAICEVTQTNVEWLVMGRGEQKGDSVRSPPGATGGDETPASLDYKLMDDVVLSVDLEPKIRGVSVTPHKCSSILTLVYNMSRMARRVDRESVDRVLGLSLG